MTDSDHSPAARTSVAVAMLGVLTVVAVGFVLKTARSVVLPLVIAWLLSYVLGPIIDFLRRRRAPNGLAVALVLVLLLFVCYEGAIFLNARVNSFVAEFPKYQERLSLLIDTLRQRWDFKYDPFAGIDWGRQIYGGVVRLSGSLLAFLSYLLKVIIFLVFLLLGRPYFKYKILKALSSEHSDQVTHIMQSISRQIGRYLGVQFMVSLATGVLIWAALALLGIDFAVTWGALAFFLNFIPTIGSILASIPPILVALVQYYPDWWHAVGTLLAVLTIQMVIGNGVAPKVMGDKLNLSPLVVLLSLVFWGWLWGGTGALLSVPIAATIKIVCENIQPLRPLSIMMGSGKLYRKEFED